MARGDAYKVYIAGSTAGIATVVTGHPFDTVKVKLQTNNTQLEARKYKNALHCAAQILKNEGIRGFYRGATPAFLGMAFESSLAFGIYSQLKKTLQGDSNNGKPQLHEIFPSAALAGSIISFILCPTELVKCRMQVLDNGPTNSKFTSPLDCALRTINKEGIKGIFRGGVATLLRESIGNGVFFSTYEYTRYHMNSQLSSLSLPVNQHIVDVGIGIITGGLAGMVYWSTVLPIDVTKTIIQTDMQSTRSPFQALSLIYRRVGLKGCYAGLGPTLMRAFPANAAAIVAWEFSAKILGISRDQK